MVRKPYQLRDFIAITNSLGNYKGQVCTQCGRLATKEALFKSGGAVIVEEYCESCLQGERFERIQAFYSTIG